MNLFQKVNRRLSFFLATVGYDRTHSSWQDYVQVTGWQAEALAKTIQQEYDSDGLAQIIQSVDDKMYRPDPQNPGEGPQKDRSLRPTNIRILCAATVAARPKTLLHVGGFWGRTSIASILALMSVQNGGEPSDYRIDIVEIDPEWHKIIEKNITSFGLENVAHVHYGSSLDVIPRLLDHCEGYDFAFLDGDHRFETVTKELRLLTDRVKVLAFDDLNQSSGPGQVFEELVVLHPTIIFNSHKVDRHDMRMYLRTTSKAWQEKVLHENQDRMVMQNGVGSRMGIALMDTDIG